MYQEHHVGNHSRYDQTSLNAPNARLRYKYLLQEDEQSFFFLYLNYLLSLAFTMLLILLDYRLILMRDVSHNDTLGSAITRLTVVFLVDPYCINAFKLTQRSTNFHHPCADLASRSGIHFSVGSRGVLGSVWFSFYPPLTPKPKWSVISM